MVIQNPLSNSCWRSPFFGKYHFTVSAESEHVGKRWLVVAWAFVYFSSSWLRVWAGFDFCLQVHFAQVSTLLSAQGCWSVWTTTTDTVALWPLVGCRQWKQTGEWGPSETACPQGCLRPTLEGCSFWILVISSTSRPLHLFLSLHY